MRARSLTGAAGEPPRGAARERPGPASGLSQNETRGGRATVALSSVRGEDDRCTLTTVGASEELFHAHQVRVLEQVASGVALPLVLDTIVRLIEAQPGGTQCSILLLDRAAGVVRHGAAPNLPPDYVHGLDGSAIGPEAGSCGRAAYLGERVIVEDIATHPHWANYRHLALPHGLRACWSTPIFSRSNEVLGTFAMYYRSARGPTAEEMQWVASATHLAAIAISHEQSQATLAHAEQRSRRLARFYAASNGINEAIIRHRDMSEIYAKACRLVVEHEVARLAWVGRRAARGGCLEAVARFGFDEGYVDEILKLIESDANDSVPARRALRHGGRVICNDVRGFADCRWKHAMLSRGLLSCAVYALLHQGEVTGVFALYGDAPNAFSSEEADILSALAADLSLAAETTHIEAERKRLVWELSERVKELTLLHQAARLLEARAPLEWLLDDLVQLLPDAWQHPSLCEARITCDGIVAQTAGFFESAWILRAPFGTAEGHGAVEVAYRQAPAGARAAFLDEEVELLGSLATLIASHLDRRHFEAASMQSERRLRAVIEHMPNVFIQWYDVQSRLLHCNRATEQLFGMTTESARGKTLEQLNFAPSEAERFRDAIQTVATTGQAVGPTEFQFRRPDGNPGVILSTIFELPANGEERCFACMDIDLTEHRRMEQAARAEGRLRELIYCSVVDILFCVAVEPDNVYRFVAVNPAFSSAAQRTEREIVGRRLEEVIPATLLPMTLGRYAEAIAERRPVSWEQMCEEAAWPRHAEVTLTPVFDATGQCENLVGTVRDITARKRADEERRSLEQQLHHAQRLQALGTLAGGIAHDFNNVLAAISGNTELGLLELDSSHPAHECLTEIEKATRRASDLVRQILAFSRHDVSSRTRLDVRELIAEVARLLRATFPAHIAFELDLAEDTPPICADGSQLHQVLMNLGTNAALAIGARHGTVRFSTRRHRSTAAALDGPPELVPGACYAQLAVIDDGCGMDGATLGRMFEPFFTTRPQGRGTGLGLSVVHGIVHRHDGALTVESVLGQGTAFRLYFPASDAVPLPAARVERASAPGSGSHILFVDDEQALVFLAERLLPLMGYRVTAYTDSIRALADFRTRAGEFDAVATDFSMPGLSGPALVQEVWRVRHDIPVVMTSGYIGPEELDAARAVGIEEIVLKPQSMNDLARVIHERLAALARRDAGVRHGESRDLSSTPKSHSRAAFEA